MAKYGKKVQKKVERAMRKRKHGTLKSGRSGKKVTSRAQAIAIGLSEAREEGAKVPLAPKKKKTARKKAAGGKKKTTRKKSTSKKTSRRKSTSRKKSTGRKKSTSRKRSAGRKKSWRKS